MKQIGGLFIDSFDTGSEDRIENKETQQDTRAEDDMQNQIAGRPKQRQRKKRDDGKDHK